MADGAEEESDLYEVGADAADAEPSKAPLVYDDDDTNLVAAFMAHVDGVAALKKISRKVHSEFTEDWEATEEYRKRIADDWKLFAGDLPMKDWPFKHCANAHVPIMLKTISRITFRAESELFGDWRNVFQVTPVGPDDEEIAQVLTHHGNWQIRKKLPDFKRQMSKAALMFFMFGDVTVHSYWDPLQKRNRHDVLLPDEFVVPFVYKTMEPNYSDVPHYTRIFNFYKHDLEARRDEFYGIDEVIDKEPPAFDDEPEQLLARSQAEAIGQMTPSDSKSSTYKILHWEGWLRLPNKDYDCWCQVILDYRTKAILKLTIHEEEDWQDRERFDRQDAELQDFRGQMQQHADMVMQHQQMVESAVSMAMSPQHADELRMQGESEAPQPPMPPDWIDPQDETAIDDPEFAPEPIKRVPIYMFSHGVCIEPLTGNLGLGYGRVASDYNRAANTALNQFIDQATLSNAKGYIVAGAVTFDGDLQIGPGIVNRAAGVSPGDLKNAVIPMEVGAANPQLAEVVDRMERYGDEAAQAPEILSGEPGKSGETFRGVAARIEQATKQIGVPTGKFADLVANVLKNNGKLNAIFMPDEEVFRVENHLLQGPDAAEHQWLKAGRELYDRPYDVEISSDLRFTSQAQRVSEADEVTALTAQDPMLQINPLLRFLAVRKSLQARGRYDMIRALGSAPPAPQMFGMPPAPPPGMMPPPGAPPGNDPNAPPAPPPQATPAPPG